MNDGRKKKPQKHKNKTAFKITFDTQALEQQKKVSLNNLCVRCTQVMQWKLQYNKYKKMTQPARCNLCKQKSVYRTYMTACQPCVQKHNVCSKCLTPDYEQPEEVKVLQKDQKKMQKVEYNKQIDFMKTLQERSRRTVRRGLQKGKISWDNELEYFVDEQGEKMIGLHFRKGFRVDEEDDVMDQEDGDDDMFGDDDDQDDMQGDDDEEQEQQQELKKQKKQQKVTKTQTTSKETKSKNKSKKQQQQQQKDQQSGNSDIEGDEVECDLDDDLQNQQQQQQDEEQGQQKLQQQLEEMDIDGDVDFEDVGDDQEQEQEQDQDGQQQKQKKKKTNINSKKRAKRGKK